MDGSISPSLALVSFSSSCDFSWKDSSSLIIQHCESICEERHLHMTAALKTAFRKNMTQPVLQFINSAFKMCSFSFLKTLNWHYVRVYSICDEERKTGHHEMTSVVEFTKWDVWARSLSILNDKNLKNQSWAHSLNKTDRTVSFNSFVHT